MRRSWSVSPTARNSGQKPDAVSEPLVGRPSLQRHVPVVRVVAPAKRIAIRFWSRREFGRFAAGDRARRGLGRPETPWARVH